MVMTLQQIAAAIGGRLVGDGTVRVECVCPVEAPVEGGICVVWDQRGVRAVVGSAAAAVVAPEGIEVPGVSLVSVPEPRAALVELLELLHPRRRPAAGIQPGARVSPEARCSSDVFVACGAQVEAGAELGPRVEIHANAYVGEGVVVGEGSIVYPHVTLYPGTRIGARVILHAGAVIGSDGFGYQRDADGRYRKIPQVGVVEIEDDVEVGAGTTIDRAMVGRTVVRRGTKIDNLVQIGHNCDIGVDCCIVAQVGVAGTVKIGDRSELGGQAGIVDHVRLGAGVRVAAGAGVTEDLPEGDWMGGP
jgi:UDP-3-O-[3-hydroxymyristoyl] glucosamine N-acyltransferase